MMSVLDAMGCDRAEEIGQEPSGGVSGTITLTFSSIIGLEYGSHCCDQVGVSKPLSQRRVNSLPNWALGCRD